MRACSGGQNPAGAERTTTPRAAQALIEFLTAELHPISPNYVAFSGVLSDRVHDVLLGRPKALPDDFAGQLTAALQGK